MPIDEKFKEVISRVAKEKDEEEIAPILLSWLEGLSNGNLVLPPSSKRQIEAKDVRIKKLMNTKKNII